MSKTEIVKSLNDCGPQLQILQTLREISIQGQSLSQELAPLAQNLREQADRMQEQTSDLSTDMKSLPQALASEVAPMLAELERLAGLLDTNMEAQRSTFGAIAEASAESWGKQLLEAQELNHALRERLTALEAREELAVKAARAMLAVPAKIEKTVEDHARTMALAVEEWKDHERSKKPWRLVLAAAVLAALLAVALHPVGTLVSEKLRSSDQMETDALAMRQLWERATPGERDLMTGILKRRK
jgi:hypothetical protein